jgi:hypothetical protein
MGRFEKRNRAELAPYPRHILAKDTRPYLGKLLSFIKLKEFLRLQIYGQE